MRAFRPARGLDTHRAALTLAATALASLVTSCGSPDRGEALAPTAPTLRRPPGAPGAAVRIVLTPSVPTGGRLSIDQGQSIELTARAVDSAGRVVPGVSFRFAAGTGDERLVSASPADFEAGSQTGVVTSLGPSGRAFVSVVSDPASGGLLSGVDLDIRQVATRLVVLPASVRLLPDGSRRLTAAVLDLVGDTIPTTPIAYGGGGAIAGATADGVVRARGSRGAATVTVRSGPFAVDVPVEVVARGHPEGRLVATVPLPGKFTPDGAVTNEGIAYVTQLYSGTVYRVDLATRDVAGWRPDPRYDDLRGVALDPTGFPAFVAASWNSLDGPLNDVLRLGPDGRPTLAYPTTGYRNAPIAVKASADGRTVYAGTGSGSVLAWDVATGRRLWEVATGMAVSLALHPSRPVLYASFSGGVVEIDTRSGDARTLALGGAPPNDPILTESIAISPDGRELYVTRVLHGQPAVVVWDTEARTVAAEIPMPAYALGIVATPDGAQLYVGSQYLFPGEVWVVDVARRAVVSTIAVGGVVGRLAISPDGATVIAPNASGWVDFIR
jgi:DNA-binding beta-propeller fold protein YncE